MVAEPKTRNVLWISPNLPRPEQDGGDLRRWQMITALSRYGTAVSVWSETGHDSGRYGPVLENAKVTWSAPPPAARQSTHLGSGRRAIHDLVTRQPWDSIVISFSYLADRHLAWIRKAAPASPVLIDLGNPRFHQSPKAEETEVANVGELEIYEKADGLITATEADTSALHQSLPQVAGYTFAPLAPEPPEVPQSQIDGPLVFWGNMAHHANANAVGWWIEELAGEVARRHGSPIPLELRGPGAGVYKSVWGTSGKLEVGADEEPLDGARLLLLPLRHGSETAATALLAAVRGIPVVASSAAVAGLHSSVRDHVSLGDDAEELGRLIVQLVSDDESWRQQRDHAFAAAGALAKRRSALEQEFANWMSRSRPVSATYSDAS
ncbi:MAG: hypothetical protein V3S01_00040 [Dehalococcoidia bacterium]